MPDNHKLYYLITLLTIHCMNKTLTKVLLVGLVATILPFSTTMAGGSMPATTLTGSVTADNTVKLSWSVPDKTNFKYIYDFYEGYAVFRDDKIYAMLKFSNNNYSYYNRSILENGNYDFSVSLYYYDVGGLHYVNPSNTVNLTISGNSAPIPAPVPAPAPAPQPMPFPKLLPKIKPLPAIKDKHIKLSVDESASNKVILNWTAYTGTLDGYVIEFAEVGKKGKAFPKNTIYYYVSGTSTSFDGLNAAAGHKYRAQVIPYTNNGNGTISYTEGGRSNRKLVKIDEESGKIVLTAVAVGGKIEASFTASGKQVDGYAIYVVKGKKGTVNLASASPVFLAKDKTTFIASPSDAGLYTLKVYAYNERPDGTKVYHQPGSNWVTVENTIL